MKIEKSKDGQYKITRDIITKETSVVDKGTLLAEKDEIEKKHIPDLEKRLEEIEEILKAIKKVK